MKVSRFPGPAAVPEAGEGRGEPGNKDTMEGAFGRAPLVSEARALSRLGSPGLRNAAASAYAGGATARPPRSGRAIPSPAPPSDWFPSEIPGS